MEKSDWIKVESKSTRPGTFYYFNKVTKKSSWKEPPELKVASKDKNVKDKVTQNASPASSSKQSLPHAKVTTSAAGTQNSTTVSNMNVRTTQKPPLLRVSHSRLQSKTNSCKALTVARNSVHLQTNSNNCMETACPDIPDEEAMDVEERWGEDQVVDMDVDMTEEEQLQLISEIHSTRSTLPLANSVLGIANQPSGSLTSTKLYLVLDTNILISHLAFLKDLKDYAIKSVGRPVLVIPWVVMQELDALKTRSNHRLADKARNAIRFLNDCFLAQHPRVRGQTMEEVQTEIKNIAISNNDDRILHCCLLYQELVRSHGGIVVLFSNDLQLCSKAMVNQVRALNRKTLFNDLRVIFKNGAPPSLTSGPAHGHATGGGTTPQTAPTPNKVVLVNREEVEDLLCEAEGVVCTALSAAIHEEFVKAYGADLWQDLLVIKPPWQFKDTIALIQRHWIAVFRDPLPSYMPHTCLATLQQHIKMRDRTTPSVSVLESLLSSSTELLRAFANVSGYSGVLPQSLAQLSTISEKLTQIKTQGTVPAGAPNRRLSTGHVTTPVTQTASQFPSPTSSGVGSRATPSHPLPHIATLLSPSCDDILQLCGAMPSTSLEQLQWVVTVIDAVSRQCWDRIFYSIRNNPLSLSDKQDASVFLSQLLQILNSTTAAINNMLGTKEITQDVITQMLMSFQSFLHTTLRVGSPLTMDNFVQCVFNSTLQVEQLLREALENFRARLISLQQLSLDLGLQ